MTMLQRLSLATALGGHLLTPTPAHAQITIKAGTMAPENSVWTRTLREMGDSWKRRTNGRVTLRVFPGTAGSESRMLRDLRISRTLHVAQLSVIELSRLDDGFGVFGLPMFFASYEELDAVLAALGPMLEERLERRGLKVLHWAHGGWVHVFARSPIATVDDLKRLKLFTSAGDNRLAGWYRDNGFNPVPIDASQMLASLSTGMIEAVPMTPLSAQLFMWYEHVPYMLEIGLAPLVGATVVSLDAWKRIAPADQHVLLEEARRAGARLRAEVPRLDVEAVAQMRKRKLTVVSGNHEEWRRAAEAFGSAMRDRLVPPDVYDAARRTRDAARAGRSASR